MCAFFVFFYFFVNLTGFILALFGVNIVVVNIWMMFGITLGGNSCMCH